MSEPLARDEGLVHIVFINAALEPPTTESHMSTKSLVARLSVSQRKVLGRSLFNRVAEAEAARAACQTAGNLKADAVWAEREMRAHRILNRFNTACMQYAA